MLLEFRLYSVKQSNDPWVTKWGQIERKQLRPHESSSMAYIWDEWAKLLNETQSSVCMTDIPGQDWNQAPTEHNSRVLLPHQPA